MTSPVYGRGCPGPSTASLYSALAAMIARNTAIGARRRQISGTTVSVVSPYAGQVAGSSSGARHHERHRHGRLDE